MYSDKHNPSKDENIPIKKVALPYEKERVDRENHMFLKGPIPYPFLIKVAHLPGKVFHVAIVLWFLFGLTKSKTVTLKNSALREFGVKRHSGYRALKKLEEAGLVSVLRSTGRNPIVTLIE